MISNTQKPYIEIDKQSKLIICRRKNDRKIRWKKKTWNEIYTRRERKNIILIYKKRKEGVMRWGKTNQNDVKMCKRRDDERGECGGEMECAAEGEIRGATGRVKEMGWRRKCWRREKTEDEVVVVVEETTEGGKEGRRGREHWGTA